MVREFDLVGKGVKLVLKDNVLAVVSDAELSTVSGAIYNGGFRKTRAILNIEVPDTYGDRRLHDDPIGFVRDSAKKLQLTDDFVSLVTAAKVRNFSLVRKQRGAVAVSVVATAGCSHAESAGEEIDAQHVVEGGTINVIVVIDGNPLESCLVAALATAVEAKASAMRDLDIRSRYTGEAATGTITDSVAVAATGAGEAVSLAGPASELGQLVAWCTRRAVREAVTNQGECLPVRSVADRLRDRHLSVEKLAAELSKVKSFGLDEKALSKRLTEMLKGDAVFAGLVLAAVRMDEDAAAGLVPPEVGEVDEFGKALGALLGEQSSVRKTELARVRLPPVLRRVLVAKLEAGLCEAGRKRLK